MIIILQPLLESSSILPGITLLGSIADTETWHQYDGYVSVGEMPTHDEEQKHKGVPPRQPHRHSGLANLPSMGAVP